MRRPLSLLVLALITAAWVRNAVGAVTAFPADGCPTSDATAAHLRHLGALDLLSQLGSAEVRVEEPSLRLIFRDLQGEALGSRTVKAPTDCEARAALAAAVIAAFAGEWAQTALAPPSTRATAKSVTSAPARQPWQSELGAMGFAIHDGDAGGFGLGLRADLGRGPWLASALVEGSFEQEQPLGSGQGRYHFLRAGLGLGVRKQWSQFFWDASLVPMVDRLSLAGQNLEVTRTVTRWGLVTAGQTRVGWTGWRLRPFLFVEASYRFPKERMTLGDRSQVKVPLSPLNVAAGLGISLKIAP